MWLRIALLIATIVVLVTTFMFPSHASNCVQTEDDQCINKRFKHTVYSFVLSTIRIVVIFAMVVEILDLLHVKWIPILTSIGVAFTLCGFVFRDIINDVVVGKIILILGNVLIGDTVEFQLDSGHKKRMVVSNFGPFAIVGRDEDNIVSVRYHSIIAYEKQG